MLAILLIAALVMTPTPWSWADDRDNDHANTGAGLMSVMEAASQGLQQYQQTQAQNQAQAQFSSALQRIAPQSIRDPFFSSCTLLDNRPPPGANQVFGQCRRPITNAMEFQQVSQLTQFAQQTAATYGDFGTESLKPGSPIGLQCLQEQKKLLENKLKSREDSIKSIMTSVQEQNELFKKEAQKRPGKL